MSEFRYHDELPATGEWPGGKRYGYSFRREMRPRVWSDADQARAEAYGIELPAMDMQTCESWWDQPDPVMAEIITHGDIGLNWLDTPDTTTFEQRTITAKRWRVISWRWQPPWARREPR